MEDQLAREIKEQALKNGLEEDDDEMLYREGVLYVSEIIKTEPISRHHNDLPVGYFGIKKTYKLVG